MMRPADDPQARADEPSPPVADEAPAPAWPRAFESALLPPTIRHADHPRPALPRPMVLVALAWLTGLTLGWSVPIHPAAPLLGAALAFAAALLERPMTARLNAWLDARRGTGGAEPGRARVVDPAPFSGLLALTALALIGWAAAGRADRVDRRAEAIARAFEAADLARAEGVLSEAPMSTDSGWRLTLAPGAALASGQAPGPPTLFPAKILVYVSDPNRPRPGGPGGNAPAPDPKPAAPAAGNPNPARAENDARLGPALDALPGPTPRLFAGLFPGCRIAVWGRVRAAEAATSPGATDMRATLRSRGAGASFSVGGPADVQILARPGGLRGAWGGLVAGTRSRIDRALGASLSPDSAAMARALFLGDARGIGADLKLKFTRTGLIHLLSVSGAHTGFILLLIVPLGRGLGLRPWALTAFAAAGLVFYASLTGMQPPVIRAAIMATFVLAGWSLRRPSSSLAALAASAFFTSAWDPRDVLRADWQLSYLCIASIALLVPVMYELIPRVDRAKAQDMTLARLRLGSWGRLGLWLPLVTTLAAQMGIFPIQSRLFEQVSLVGLLIQAPAIFLAAAVVTGSTVVGVLGAALPAWAVWPVAAPLDLACRALGEFIDWGSTLPGAALPLRPAPAWLLGAYYLFLIVGPHLLEGGGTLAPPTRRAKLHALARIGVFAALCVWLPPFGTPTPGAPLELFMIDVGQGDCLALRLPDGRVGLIDGGPTRGRDPARQPAVAFLRKMGIDRLDFVLATHADADHIGGLPAVIRSVPVGVFMHGPDRANTGLAEDLGRALTEKSVPRRQIKVGDAFAAGPGCRITALNPAPGFDNNDASVVWLVDLGGLQILLTGDIEAPAERAMLAAGLARDIDILKVAHHGSATSTSDAFLDAFRPEIALISVGRKNRFGHPKPEVMERLARRGILEARTDQWGTVAVQSDGRRARLIRFLADR